MSSILEIVRRVVEQEMARNRGSLLGVVSTVFPHTAENDENNYEVNVKLKHEGLELRRVPVAVGHVGVVAPPRAGDLVLVQFINGDLNQPVVTGRFYHAEERPPLHKEDEVLFEHRMSKTSVKIDGASGEIEIKVGDDIKVELKSDKIKITGDVEINGDLVVSNGSNKTTISGNSIEGA